MSSSGLYLCLHLRSGTFVRGSALNATKSATILAGSLRFYRNGEYLYCSFHAHDGRVSVGTGLKVTKEAWEKGKLPKDVTALQAKLTTAALNYDADCRQKGVLTYAEDVKNLLKAALGKSVAKAGTLDTLSVFDRYTAAIESGQVLNKGKRYSKSWLVVATSVRSVLAGSPLAKMDVSRVDEDDLRSFASLATKGRSQNTAATYVSLLVGVINNTRRLNWHEGKVLDGRAFRISAEDIDHGQYLTKEEQDLMAKVPLEKKAAVYRDMFLLGCQLGMRFSDLRRLTSMNRRGNLVNINTKKTGAPVWVPLNPIGQELWDKVMGVPVPSIKWLNGIVSQAAKDAGINKPVLFSRTSGGVKKDQWKEKWELISSHVMRRSFATNAFKAGVPAASIMRATGHKTTESFLKYIRLSDEEHAALLQAHEHFQ